MKKVLIISYYWPPCGGIGVLRCLKIAKYLRDFGWEPIVFTAENAHYPSLDPSNEKDIPKGMTVLKQRIWEPYHFYKFLTGQKKDANVNNVFYVKEEKLGRMHNFSVWVRSNFFIPDARAMWIKPSVRYLLKYLKANPVDAIFSDGPPHSNTRIANLVHNATGIPWLADFQDPWTQVDYFQKLKLTKWGRAKHERLEQEAFQSANKTTIVSPTWRKELIAIGAQNVSVIPWGYDPEDYENLEKNLDVKFTLTHLGIMGYDRTPKALFQAVKELCEELPGFRAVFELKLVGQVDFSILELMEELGIEENVNLVGSVDRKTALGLMRNSRLLLLLLNQQDNIMGRIPGKLFEYLAVRRPILNQGPPDSDVATIIDSLESGETLDYTDLQGLKTTLKNYYEAFTQGALDRDLSSDISQYSIKTLTGKIAGYLEEIT